MDFKGFYRKNYKKLVLVPAVMFLISLAVIYAKYQATGDFVSKDVDFQGGTALTLQWDQFVDRLKLEREVSKNAGGDVSVSVATDYAGKVTEIVFEAGKDMESEKLKSAVAGTMGVELTDDNSSIKSTGPAMGASFLASAQKVMIAAFILTSSVAFLIFRVPEVSAAIFLCSLMNVVGAIGGMNLLGIQLNAGSLAALLMFIGGSIDDNILIVTRALERKTGVIDHAFLAFNTGMVMFTTKFLAFAGLRFLTTIPIFVDFASVLMIGSIVDLINTWLQNTGMVLWYVERKEGKAAL